MNRSLVETCVLGLNHMNHAILFGEAPDNENAYQAWKEERPEWGDMFDAVARCLSGRSAASGAVLPCSGQWLTAGRSGPTLIMMVRNQAESFSDPPRVYTWKRPSGWGYRVNALCDGRDVVGVYSGPPVPSQSFIIEEGDDATRGSQSQCRVLLVNGPQEDTAALSRQRRMLLEQRASSRRANHPTPSHTPVTSKRGSFDQTPPATPKHNSGTTTPKEPS